MDEKSDLPRYLQYLRKKYGITEDSEPPPLFTEAEVAEIARRHERVRVRHADFHDHSRPCRGDFTFSATGTVIGGHYHKEWAEYVIDIKYDDEFISPHQNDTFFLCKSDYLHFAERIGEEKSEERSTETDIPHTHPLDLRIKCLIRGSQ